MAIIDYADLLGKPFSWGGRGPEEYDCYGVAKEVCRRGGVELPPWESVCSPGLIQAGFDAGKELFIKCDRPEPFDIVLLMVRPPFVSHCGVMLDAVRFIHIMERTSVAIERIDTIAWQRRVHGFYRLRR